ncbi:MAG: GHMP kinase [Spirochaetes bacterium]|nr:GHMP kinase [Spirochaetota bacterium]
MIIKTQAFARAGLLGNPSDGYYGKTISIIVKNFGVTVIIYESPELRIEPSAEDVNSYKNVYELVESINENGYYGATRLIKASIKKFYQYLKDNSIKFDNKNFTIQYYSTIPRQVGLAGSSAIVTATVRALIKFYEIDIPLEYLPTLVLSVEKDELGITAGLQDRVAQCYEGCVYMDFDKKHLDKKNYGIYERIDTKLLHNIYIAYKTTLSKVSGDVLNNIRVRYNQGDEPVIKTLNEIAQIAEEGKKTIMEKNGEKLHELINKNFDLRCKIMNISQSNMEIIKTARSCGASAKFAGSGGSIIGTYKNDEVLTKLIVELKKINVRVIKPFIS